MEQLRNELLASPFGAEICRLATASPLIYHQNTKALVDAMKQAECPQSPELIDPAIARGFARQRMHPVRRRGNQEHVCRIKDLQGYAATHIRDKPKKLTETSIQRTPLPDM